MRNGFFYFICKFERVPTISVLAVVQFKIPPLLHDPDGRKASALSQEQSRCSPGDTRRWFWSGAAKKNRAALL